MKKFLLASPLLFSVSLSAALEVVIPRTTLINDDASTAGYMHLHFQKVGKQVRQICKHLILGQRLQLHALLDRYGDLSSLPTDDLKKLLSRAEFNREYQIVRRLLTYKNIYQHTWMLRSKIGTSRSSCHPISVLCAKFLLISVARKKRNVEVIKREYLNHVERIPRINDLPESPLREFFEFLNENWDQSLALAEKYEAYFNFHDAVERADEKKLHQYLPLSVRYHTDYYDDEFGESVLDKAERLGHVHIKSQIGLFRAFGSRFVSYIMHGTDDEHVRAAILVQRCPALASEHIINELGETALHAAVHADNLRLVQLLIMTNPALIACKSNYGLTPIEYMIDGHQDTLLLPLIHAAKALEEDARKRISDKTQLPLIIAPIFSLCRAISSVFQAITAY